VQTGFLFVSNLEIVPDSTQAHLKRSVNVEKHTEHDIKAASIVLRDQQKDSRKTSPTHSSGDGLFPLGGLIMWILATRFAVASKADFMRVKLMYYRSGPIAFGNGDKDPKSTLRLMIVSFWLAKNPSKITAKRLRTQARPESAKSMRF